ncbi:AT-rich interactive domain-containing protein 2-like [Cornus florida]|uniref:AT-rich interactive domain-containing protein 2-like n=1 Tax=Cornus florida TaxID=4283 RepID=UPI0028A08E2B|nr:AT-rich interactive domain-containing protein 2-like [Cornus florida]
MQKLKQLNLQKLQRRKIKDDHLRLAIPVGPRFQADIPDWIGPPPQSESSTSSWLGTQVWPIKDRSAETKGDAIGKGRPDFCLCDSPGSVECVKRHVTDRRIQLQYELGPAFWKWKFDEMGEEVSKLWNMEEQKKFDSLVKMNPISKGKSFMKPALKSLQCHCRKSIVSYYFNSYVPKRISMKTRSGCKIIDTDDEEAGGALYSKCPQKRSRAEYVKTHYLTGRR